MSQATEVRLACPHCGCDTFWRRVGAQVHIIDEGESIRDDEIGGEEYYYACVECDRDVSEDELVRAPEAEGGASPASPDASGGTQTAAPVSREGRISDEPKHRVESGHLCSEADVVFRYTDRDAIEDGVLVPLRTPAGADTAHRNHKQRA